MTHDVNNIMVILSSPSGAGKTTITKKFSKNINHLKYQSHLPQENQEPTRLMGLIIILYQKKKFKEYIKENKFYEYAKIFDNYYGTLKKNVDEMILKNDIIFDIDWQGTKQLSKFKNLKLVKIYLIPPNKEELKQRLIKRNLDPSLEVEKDLKHSMKMFFIGKIMIMFLLTKI